ncbi:MAG: PIN domain-containing protein [archaeon]|nr:PIN domain-containing protein [archaeon]
MSILLDSSFTIAFANQKDKYHENALGLSELIKSKEFGEVFTSTYVFDETITYILARHGHSKAVEIGKMLLNSEITVLRVSENVFAQAWELFQSRQNLSFTDCTNVKLMAEHNIKNLATFDHHFRQFKEINLLI